MLSENRVLLSGKLLNKAAESLSNGPLKRLLCPMAAPLPDSNGANKKILFRLGDSISTYQAVSKAKKKYIKVFIWWLLRSDRDVSFSACADFLIGACWSARGKMWS